MKELYTLNTDTNNYVLSIAHTPNDNIELDLSEYDLTYLCAYQYLDGELVLDEIKKQKLIDEEKNRENQPTFEEIQNEINIDTDYRLSCLELGI